MLLLKDTVENNTLLMKLLKELVSSFFKLNLHFKVEVLIKGHDGYKSKELAYLEKVDILALMYLKNIFLLQDDLKQIRIEYSEAYDFVEVKNR